MRRVGQVEGLGAELRVEPLGELERAIDAEVEVACAGAAQRVIAGRAEARAASRARRPCGSKYDGGIAEDCDLGLDLVGALVAARQAEGVAGA